MNSTAIAEIKHTEAPAIADDTMSQIMLNSELLKGIQDLAKNMAQATVTVPKHLAGSPADCYAVILQAVQWKMNPFAVAQKTHVVNGTLGYEAQLVNAVIQASGAVASRFHYEYQGEGAKLACRVGAIIRGESGITWNEWLSFESVTTKNSPLWKTNPKQQLGYLQVKNWGRAYCPGAILGVYTPDELAEAPEREINPAATNAQPAASSRTEALKSKLMADDPVEAEVVEDLPEQDDPEQESPAPNLTYAVVAEAINDASTPQALQAAVQTMAEFVGIDGNEKFKDELGNLYRARLKQLKAAAD